jgi:hypothetical protein
LCPSPSLPPGAQEEVVLGADVFHPNMIQVSFIYTAVTSPSFCPCQVLKDIYNFLVFLYFRKAESDEEQKKRQLIESIDAACEDVPFTKKARLDLPLVRLL